MEMNISRGGGGCSVPAFQRFVQTESTRSERLRRRVARQRFVTMSPLRRGEKVASRRGSGRQARSASRALYIQSRRQYQCQEQS